MRPIRLALSAVLLSFSLLSPGPAAAAKAKALECEKGQTAVRGKCVKACAIEGVFGEPDSCECPKGYGKILTGSGGGQCSRLRCPANSEMPADKDCECPQNFEKRKIGKGKVRCELPAR